MIPPAQNHTTQWHDVNAFAYRESLEDFLTPNITFPHTDEAINMEMGLVTKDTFIVPF